MQGREFLDWCAAVSQFISNTNNSNTPSGTFSFGIQPKLTFKCVYTHEITDGEEMKILNASIICSIVICTPNNSIVDSINNAYFSFLFFIYFTKFYYY